MQATSLKESNIDPSTKTNVKIDPFVGPVEIKQKPPQINQDLTNKVFSNIDQMNAQSKAVAESDRNPKSKAEDSAASAEKKDIKSN